MKRALWGLFFASFSPLRLVSLPPPTTPCFGYCRSGLFITFSRWCLPLSSLLTLSLSPFLLLFSPASLLWPTAVHSSLLYGAISSTPASFPVNLDLPLSIHPSLSLAYVTPPSRDNYYKPCEDQLVFKQLNKQGLGLLTATIQPQSRERVE